MPRSCAYGRLLVLALTVFAVGCASAPRDPARIQHRDLSSRSAPVYSTPSACSGASYTVRRGDTLSEIAEACNVALSELASSNGLYRPYTLSVGQTLRLPAPAVHVVRRGENLYRIGLRYGLDYRDLAALNGIRAPYSIEIGDQIRLPSGATAIASSSTTSSSPARRDRPPVRIETREEDRRAPAPTATGAPRFDWPVRGDVISNFGPKESGRRNDGVNIRVAEGASVRAAAEGQVVYAGGELAGYGELILIRHSGGYVTAYAHNSRLLVSEGEQVSRGQVIAEAGATGSVDSPQVHFEIRRGTRPEDPMGYLR